MLQLAWKLISDESQRAILLWSRYFSKGQPIQHYFKLSIWCGIKRQIATVIANSICSGEKIHFWTNNWLGEPLVDILQINPLVHINFNGLLCDVITNAAWNIPVEVIFVPDVASRLECITLPSSALLDLFSWSHAPDGKLSAKLAFSFLRLPCLGHLLFGIPAFHRLIPSYFGVLLMVKCPRMTISLPVGVQLFQCVAFV